MFSSFSSSIAMSQDAFATDSMASPASFALRLRVLLLGNGAFMAANTRDSCTCVDPEWWAANTVIKHN